jgi:hypothetical protein
VLWRHGVDDHGRDALDDHHFRCHDDGTDDHDNARPAGEHNDDSSR